MRNNVTVSFSHTYDEWVIKYNGLIEDSHDLKQDAEKAAREMAKRHKPSRLSVQRKDQGVSYEQFYDPE